MNQVYGTLGQPCSRTQQYKDQVKLLRWGQWASCTRTSLRTC